jgi:hypothetical protein
MNPVRSHYWYVYHLNCPRRLFIVKLARIKKIPGQEKNILNLAGVEDILKNRLKFFFVYGL